MPDGLLIRSATEADAAALADIYRPYVEDTAISFETVAPTAAELAGRVRKVLAGWVWLVAEMDGACAGYAYGTSHRERAAYRWSVETSVYIGGGFKRRGVGRALYTELLDRLSRLGLCHAFAGITMPNEPSVALHRSLGFEPIGVFRSVGWKHGAWHDVAWLQRRLRDGPPGDRAAGA
jgi:phosphinothricin acetyltransferase